MLMCQGANLADGVQHAGTRFVVAAVNHSHVGIVLQCLLHSFQVRLLVDTRFEVDVWNMIHLAHLYGTRVVGAIVHYEYLLAFGHQ